MYENNTAVVKIRNEVSSWFRIKSGVKQGCILSPFIWIISTDFVLIGKAMKTTESYEEVKISWTKIILMIKAS